jgi:hypothetical protein
MGAVAQVRREASAGGDGGTDARTRRRRVAERDDDAGSGEFFDEGQSAFVFRGKRDQTNASAGSVLKTAKFVPGGRADVAQRMSAARTILGADVRPFEMQGRQSASKIGVGGASAMDRGEAVQECFAGIGDEGGTESSDAVTAADGDDAANVVLAQTRRIETDAGAAVDLQIEQGRRDPVRFNIHAVLSCWTQARDAALLADKIHSFAGRVVPGAKTQEVCFRAHVVVSLAVLKGEQSADESNEGARQRSDAEEQHVPAIQTQ